MAAQSIPQLELTPDELREIADRARRRGFDSPTEYIREVIKADSEPVEDSDEYILAAFREGMRQSLRGEGRPADEVLAELVEDEQP